MRIERLAPDAWERLRAVRLAALREAPYAFGSTYEGCITWPPSRWQEQARTIPTLIAVVNHEDVGMVRGAELQDPPHAAILISMWVAPNARRRGVGAALVDALIAWARTLSKTELRLNVRTSNAGAIALYEAKGFHATGEETVEGQHRERSYILRLG